MWTRLNSDRTVSVARAACVAYVLVAFSALAQERAPDVPFVPTPMPVVERMLELAQISKDDVVYDLGSGDGRLVISAALRYGARAIGVELNPVWVRDARRNAAAAGVADRVTFRIEDLFETDLREATVVTLYLLPAVNRKLLPKLRSELRPGARIVSHEYGLGDWPPNRSEEMVVNGERHMIHFWIVPKRSQPNG